MMKVSIKGLFVRFFCSNMILVMVTLLGISGIFSYFVQNYYYGLREWKADNSVQKVAEIVTDSVGDESLEKIDKREVSEVLDALSESSNMEIGIVDSEAELVVNSSNIYQFDLHLDPKEIEVVLEGSRVTRKIKGPKHSYILMALPVIKRHEDAGTVRVETASSKEDMVMGAVVIQASLANISETINSILELVAYSALIALPAAVLISFLLARKITGPLVLLKGAALRIAEGDYRETTVPQNSTEEVEHLVRTFNYAVRQIRDTFEERKRLDSMRKQFVDDISHELRVPLTSIKGFLELLLEGGVAPPKMEKYFHIMYKDTEYLERLSHDLLLLGRMESRDISLSRESIDFSKIVERVLRTMELIIGNKRIDIEKHCDDNLPRVSIDADAMYQAVLNLVDNAVTHSPEGGTIRIFMQRTTIEENMTGLSVEVQDQGPGISDEQADRIWERFYKTDYARTRKEGKGSGLGLAIVKAVVERHGGHVTFRRASEGGAVLGFVLDEQSIGCHSSGSR